MLTRLLVSSRKFTGAVRPIRELKPAKSFSASFSIEEYKRIMSVLNENNLSKIDFIRKGIKNLEDK